MTATYTFDVFSSLDGYGAASANWTGNWGKQGPELLDHRLAVYGAEQRMVFGANTYRAFAQMLASSTGAELGLHSATGPGQPGAQVSACLGAWLPAIGCSPEASTGGLLAIACIPVTTGNPVRASHPPAGSAAGDR
jgi:hypothetical protein